MKMQIKILRVCFSKFLSVSRCFLVCVTCLTSVDLKGTTTDAYGTYVSWPTTWTAVPSFSDPVDGIAGRLDFVGDSTDPVLSIASNENYLFFRMRINVGTAVKSDFSDAHLLLINVAGFGTDADQFDFGLAWDSKSNDDVSHGLEMVKLGTDGATWSATKATDIDGLLNGKTTMDINGDGQSTEGYIRIVDSVSTTNFGTTTYLEFAVSKSYILENVAGLSDGYWSFQLASINNSNDHGFLSGDIAGGQSPSSTISSSSWSGQVYVSVPERSSVAAILSVFSAVAVLFRRSVKR